MQLLFCLPFWMFIKIWIVVLCILSQLSKDYLFLLLLVCSNGEIRLLVFQKVIWYWLLVSHLCTNICSKFLSVSHHLGSKEWQVSGEKAAWAAREVPGAPSPLFVLESAKVCLIERYVLGARGNCQIQNHTFRCSLCPHIRLCELKQFRRKMFLCFICLFTLVHLTAFWTPPVPPIESSFSDC